MKSNPTQEQYAQEHLIPEGEFKCIWMNAGVISYKLCKYQYECENCLFDIAMRTDELKPSIPSWTSRTRVPTQTEGGKTLEHRGAGWRMVEDLLAPFQHCVLHENLYYHFGHTWVNSDTLEGVKIGLDDFAMKVLPQTSVVLTCAPQSRIVAGRPCCWVVKDNCALSILAPLNGVILSVNSRVSEQPDLLYQDPYGEGWLITIKPDALQDDLKNLMFGETVFWWYQQDMAKLRHYFMSIFEKNRAIVGETLCDGGERHTNLYDAVGSKMYFEMIRPFFHEERR